MDTLNKYQLMLKLKDFIEVHSKTKISDVNEGVLKMYVLHSKNQNSTPKQKLINYKLLRVDEKLLNSQDEISERDSIIVEFLIDELMKYYSRSRK